MGDFLSYRRIIIRSSSLIAQSHYGEVGQLYRAQSKWRLVPAEAGKR